MKTALRVVRAHALITVFLWVLASIESVFQCGGLCGPITFFSAVAFFIFILPGYKTIGLLIPYSVDESGAVTFARELISLAATDAALFAAILLLIKVVAHVRKSEKA